MLAACSASPAPVPDNQPDVDDTEPTPEPGEVEQDAPAPSPQPSGGGTERDNTLTVWVPEAISPGGEQPGADALLTALSDFDDTYPDIQVDFQVKRVTGPGSMLSYLRTAPAVAPDVVPDLILLDRDSMLQANTESTIVPIGDIVDQEIVSRIYPAAIAMASTDDELIGLPFVLNTQHVIYREAFFLSGPPNSFQSLLAAQTGYAFPAGPLSDINRTTLAQYIAAGGRLVDEDGNSVVDVGPLTEVLTFYDDAERIGVISTDLFQIADFGETLTRYQENQVSAAEVNARDYLHTREEVRTTSFTSTPTADGESIALITGWSWVITTSDEERQELAMLLVDFFMNPVVQGNYTLSAGWIPTQPAAFEVWGGEDPYVAFGDNLIRNAQPLPSASVRAVPGEAIQQAVEDVLLNGQLPAQTANQAANSVNQPSSDGS